MRTSRRAGFTILEMVIALTILTLLITNITMVMSTGQKAFESGTFVTNLEAQATQTMDRVALSLLSSSNDSLSTVPEAPFYTSSVDFQTSMGFKEGSEVLSDPERIEFVPGTGQVLWKQNPGAANERNVVWSNWVSDFLEGELPDGNDTNGNALIDENGLAFDRNKKQVRIQVTVQQADPGGALHARTLSTRVTCRN